MIDMVYFDRNADKIIALGNQSIELGEAIEGREPVVNVTLAGTSRVELELGELSNKGDFIVEALEVVADEDEGCPVVGMGEGIDGELSGDVEADSGAG